MYFQANAVLNLNMNEFLDMCIAEVHDLISEKDKYNYTLLLSGAYYQASMTMQEKINDIYNDFSRQIRGTKNIEKTKNDIKRYKMISERIGIKFPT